MTEQPPEPPQPNFNVMMPPQIMTGVWANFAQVSQSPYEFTIDFARLDYGASVGIAVARVSMSPLMVMQLRDALEAAWAGYAQQAMPMEVVQVDDPDAAEGDSPPTGE